MSYTVYRLYDADSNLLYVGCTKYLANRLKAHSKDKEWWPDVVRVDETPVGGLNEAADLEERFYLEGAPRYNGQRHLRYPSQHAHSPRRLNVGRHFGDKLKYERFAQTLTQRQLAKMASISHATLVNIERNQVDPHVSTIRRLADALGVEPRELLPR